MPLMTQVTLHPFDKWVVHFIGPINPPMKRLRARYIIMETYYLTRWDKAEPVKDCSAQIVVWF